MNNLSHAYVGAGVSMSRGWGEVWSGVVSMMDQGSAGSGAELPFYHESILVDEILEFLAVGEGAMVVDGTLGGGGHSEAFLRAGAWVRGIDRDPEARAYARERLRGYGERFEAVAGCFGEIGELATKGGWEKADGILLDLGVSSRQLDAGERGFSFRHAGPLDMRMSGEGTTAAEIVNSWSEADLRQLFWDCGEEKAARRIAAWIVSERTKVVFETTSQLADGIEKLLGRRGKIHPATQVFQALRLEVNDELGELRRFLAEVPRVLKVGGRLGIMTFHSLEDRIVKEAFRVGASAEIDRPEWPAPRPNPDQVYRLVGRKGVTPSREEVRRNPRARSARLRVVERIEPRIVKNR